MFKIEYKSQLKRSYTAFLIFYFLQCFISAIQSVDNFYSQNYEDDYIRNNFLTDRFINGYNELFFLKNVKQSKLNFYNNFDRNDYETVKNLTTTKIYVNDLCQLIKSEEDGNSLLQAKIGRRLFTIPIIQSIYNNNQYKSTDKILWQTYFLCSVLIQPAQTSVSVVNLIQLINRNEISD